MTDKEIIQHLHSKFGDSIREIDTLPKAHKGSELKAILLGADPTNNGLKKGDKQIILKTVFGIGEYDVFFRPQLANLKAIGLSKEKLYIQNVCRNYFNKETSKNKQWSEVAKIWLSFLKEELDGIDPERKLPALVTSEVIMKVLVSETIGKARDIYDNCLWYKSEKLDREVFALYRHPAYSLLSKNNIKYTDFLKEKII